MLKRTFIGSCIGLLFSAGCGSTGVPLVCSNELDGSDYGFSLTVPAAFECAEVFPNPTSLANVGYKEASTNHTASVQVNSPQTGSPQEGVEFEDLGEVTNNQGFVFQRQKVTIEGVGISYVAGTTLEGGNLLFVTVSGSEDDASLLVTLDAIIATVSEANQTCDSDCG